MSREVMQQALKDLERSESALHKARAALRIELDHIPDAGKMAGPEPVLFIHPLTLEMASAHVGAWKPGHELPGYIALYTSSPQRQPLTDEQIDELWCEYPSDEFGFARAIEAAHEIKEKIE